jgi:hypothetical protein
MLRATFTVARSVPKEGATSESKVGVVKLRANRKLYSARSRDCKAKKTALEPKTQSSTEQIEGWLLGLVVREVVAST